MNNQDKDELCEEFTPPPLPTENDDFVPPGIPSEECQLLSEKVGSEASERKKKKIIIYTAAIVLLLLVAFGVISCVLHFDKNAANSAEVTDSDMDQVKQEYIKKGWRPISDESQLKVGEICMSDQYGRKYAVPLDFDDDENFSQESEQPTTLYKSFILSKTQELTNFHISIENGNYEESEVMENGQIYISIFALVNIDELSSGGIYQLLAVINKDDRNDLWICINSNSAGEIYVYDHTSIPHETESSIPEDSAYETEGEKEVSATVDAQGGLFLRVGPSTSEEKITLMPEGSTVIVSKIEGDWAYVTYNGMVGWCAKEYLIIGNDKSNMSNHSVPNIADGSLNKRIFGDWYQNIDYKKEYIPKLTLNSDATFSLYVNLYEGMGWVYGTYSANEDFVRCDVTSITFSGFIGDDIEKFGFDISSDKLIYIGSQLGTLIDGAIFDQNE